MPRLLIRNIQFISFRAFDHSGNKQYQIPSENKFVCSFTKTHNSVCLLLNFFVPKSVWVMLGYAFVKYWAWIILSKSPGYLKVDSFFTLVISTLKEYYQLQFYLSMGGFFSGIFSLQICKYHRHLSIHFENYYIVWKVYLAGLFTKCYLNLTVHRIRENSKIFLTTSFLLINNFWQLSIN